IRGIREASPPKPIVDPVAEAQTPTVIDALDPAEAAKLSVIQSADQPVASPQTAFARKTSPNGVVSRLKGRLPLVLILIALVAVIGGAAVALQRRPSPEEAKSHNDAGLTALRSRNYDTAIQEFQAAIQADPSFAAAYYDLGVAYE